MTTAAFTLLAALVALWAYTDAPTRARGLIGPQFPVVLDGHPPPRARARAQLVVNVLNLGTRNASAYDYLRLSGATIIFVSETKFYDDAHPAQLLAALANGHHHLPNETTDVNDTSGMRTTRKLSRAQQKRSRRRNARVNAARIISQSAPRSTKRSGQIMAQQGGIAFIIHNPLAIVHELERHDSGVIAISVHLPNSDESTLLIGLYSPPHTTPAGKTAHNALLRRVGAIWNMHRAGHTHAYIIGDFNSRLGSSNGRSSDDTMTERHDEMTSLMRNLGIAPLHGRDGQTRASTTSRHITGGGGYAEVDYCLCDNSTALAATTLRAQNWDDVPECVTHRRIGFNLSLTASDHRNGDSNGSLPKRNPKRPTPPPYNSTSWHTTFNELKLGIDRIASAITHTTPGNFLNVYGNINELLRKAIPPGPAGSSTNRRYHGEALPPNITAAFERARALRKEATRSRDPVEKAYLRERAAHATREADGLARDQVRRALDERVRNLQHDAQHDGRAFARSVEHRADMLYTGIATSFPESARDAFTDYYKTNGTAPDTPAPGLTEAPWMHHIPKIGLADHIDAPFHWTEVYMTLFNFNASVFANAFTPAGHTLNCTAGCKICKLYSDNAVAYCTDTTGNIEPPTWTSRLRTAVTGGPDDVLAEALKFVRHESDANLTHEYRVTLSRLLATVLTHIRDYGAPPGSFDTNLGPIPKGTRAGITANPADPYKSRGIAVHNCLPKLLAGIIQARLSHWGINNGVPSRNQCGFMPLRGTDWNAFAHNEAIKHRWRRGQRTWVLYIDFKSAYDRVSPTTMWAILTAMGLPPLTVAHIRRAHEQRNVHFNFNGRAAGTWHQDTGLGQGCILSPILFDYFVESLSRYLNSLNDLKGVTVGEGADSVTFNHLFYADDLSILCTSRDEAERLGEIVNDWCHAFGMELSAGPSKTAFIVYNDGVADPIGLPLDLGHGFLAPQVDEYRYLGHTMRPRLEQSPPLPGHRPGANAATPVPDVISKIHTALSVHFHHDQVLHAAGAATQIRVLKSAVISAGSHLLAMTKPTRLIERGLNAAMRNCISLITGDSNKQIANNALHSFGRAPMALELIVTSMTRFRLSMESTPFQDGLAPRIYRALKQEKRVRRGNRNDTSWIDDYDSLQSRLRKHTVGPALPSGAVDYWDIPRVAHVEGRRAAHDEWRFNMTTYLTEKQLHNGARNATSRPISSPETAFLYSLVYPTTTDGYGLGANKNATPLYAGGPGSTTVISTSTVKASNLHGISAARMGTQGLYRRPFWSKYQRDNPSATLNIAAAAAAAEPDSDNSSSDASSTDRMGRYRKHGYNNTACMLCGAADGDAIHMATSCAHATITARRARTALSSIGHTMLRIGSAYESAIHGRPPRPRHALHRHAATLRTDDNAEGSFLATRLITAQPWPSLDIPANWLVARSLGKLFESCPKRSSIATFSNMWVLEANRAITTVCCGWTELLSPAQARVLIDAGHVYGTRGAANIRQRAHPGP